LTQIHPTAIVHKKAELAEHVTIGPYSVIDGDVKIGEGSKVHSHVYIADGARIGKNCIIHHGSAVATVPQDLKFSGEETLLEIGDNVVVREFCDLNRGTSHRGKSVIGDNSFLMAYTHVAHDCLIGENVILANGVQLAGHVTIEEWVSVGGLVAVHQFCTIGKHAFIGGGFRVTQDVPPFILAAGVPVSFKGLNIIGLKRRGFPKEVTEKLQRCYRILYRSKLNTTQAVEKIQKELEPIPEVELVLRFIEKSERGIIK
jgi:UDP-N-acetylglucosamine acyltransferase